MLSSTSFDAEVAPLADPSLREAVDRLQSLQTISSPVAAVAAESPVERVELLPSAQQRRTAEVAPLRARVEVRTQTPEALSLKETPAADHPARSDEVPAKVEAQRSWDRVTTMAPDHSPDSSHALATEFGLPEPISSLSAQPAVDAIESPLALSIAASAMVQYGSTEAISGLTTPGSNLSLGSVAPLPERVVAPNTILTGASERSPAAAAGVSLPAVASFLGFEASVTTLGGDFDDATDDLPPRHTQVTQEVEWRLLPNDRDAEAGEEIEALGSGDADSELDDSAEFHAFAALEAELDAVHAVLANLRDFAPAQDTPERRDSMPREHESRRYADQTEPEAAAIAFATQTTPITEGGAVLLQATGDPNFSVIDVAAWYAAATQPAAIATPDLRAVVGSLQSFDVSSPAPAAQHAATATAQATGQRAAQPSAASERSASEPSAS